MDAILAILELFAALGSALLEALCQMAMFWHPRGGNPPENKG